MKLAKTLLATTLALTAASTFAASKHDKVHAFYTICTRLIYYILMLKEEVTHYGYHIDTLYKSHVNKIIPVDIFVKERFNVENKNPRYNVETNTENNSLQLTVNYINNPYRVGYFSVDNQGENLKEEMKNI